MEQIKTLEQLSPLISAQFKRGVMANAPLSPASFQREIQRGTLFAQRMDGGLILLRRRDGFWRMSFYLQPDGDVSSLELPKQTVLEIPTRPRDLALKQSETLWKEKGFRLLFSRQRMELVRRSDDVAVRSDCCVPLAGCCVRPAVAGDEPEILRLMEENYDRRTACLPTDDELSEDVAAGQVFLAVTCPEGQVAGFLRLLRTKRIAEVRQIAVSEPFRGRGIAGALLNQLTLAEGQKGHVWVSQNNGAALRLYESFGFVKDEWTSTVWIYE